MPLIETRDLWKTYVMGDEEIHALRGVSISIERGEMRANIWTLAIKGNAASMTR